MRKTSIIRFDKERMKYRVDTGRKQNTYVVRTPDLKTALHISCFVDQGYKEGYKDGHDKGFADGYTEAISYLSGKLHDILCELDEDVIGERWNRDV